MSQLLRYALCSTIVLALLSTCDSSPPPTIDGITVTKSQVVPGERVNVSAIVTGVAPLTYHWSATAGSFEDASTSPAVYVAPAQAGEVQICVEVTDKDGVSAMDTVSILVLGEVTAPMPAPDSGNGTRVVLEDFEGARRMRWFSPDSEVFQYNEANEQAHDGNRSFRIRYEKTDTYQFIGADPAKPELGDFTGAQALEVWVYGDVTILFKVEGKSGTGQDIGELSAVESEGWTSLRFELEGIEDLLDASDVKMLFFPAPGDPEAGGTFYVDDIALIVEP